MTTRPHPVLAAALAFPLVFGLVACGGDDDDAATAEEPTTTTTADAATSDADDAAGEVVATVFDSSVGFDDKVALIEDGESHRADHDGYVAAADRVGEQAVAVVVHAVPAAAARWVAPVWRLSVMRGAIAACRSTATRPSRWITPRGMRGVTPSTDKTR